MLNLVVRGGIYLGLYGATRYHGVKHLWKKNELLMRNISRWYFILVFTHKKTSTMDMQCHNLIPVSLWILVWCTYVNYGTMNSVGLSIIIKKLAARNTTAHLCLWNSLHKCSNDICQIVAHVSRSMWLLSLWERGRVGNRVGNKFPSNYWNDVTW